MTKEDLQAIVEAIHETGRMLARATAPPWPPPGAATVTTPDGTTLAVADYQARDLIFDCTPDEGVTAERPGLKRSPDGDYSWDSAPRLWSGGVAPVAMIHRVSCTTPDVTVTVTYPYKRDHVFHGRDLILGREVHPLIVMTDGYDWTVRTSAPARVVLGGLFYIYR